MKIEFFKVTWYSRLLSIIFFFGVFPYLVFIIGQKYQQYVDVLGGATTLSLNSYNSSTTDVVYSYNSTLNTYKKKIEGKWRNTENSKQVFVFRDLNRYFEYKNGSLVNSGAWLLKSDLSNTKYSNLPKGSYLYQRLIDDAELNYAISFTEDYEQMELRDLDTNKTLFFKREFYSPGSLKKTSY